MSKYLYFNLIFSFASSACSSISKGKVFDFDRTLTSETIISISQVVILGFACHSGLALTFHSA